MLVNEEVSLIDIRENNVIIVRNKQGNKYSINYNDVVIDWASVDYK